MQDVVIILLGFLRPFNRRYVLTNVMYGIFVGKEYSVKRRVEESKKKEGRKEGSKKERKATPMLPIGMEYGVASFSYMV
jgi:hypothetical protein